MRNKAPKRATARWLQDAPREIADVFDSRNSGERYTVVFAFPYDATPTVQYLGMSGAPSHPQGVSMWGEMKPYEFAHYRTAKARERIKWADLPENIRKHVTARLKAS